MSSVMQNWGYHNPALSVERSNMFGLGHTEILIIAVVILLIFGGKKIPELMKGIGQGIKSLRDGVKEGEEDEQ
jgi:sec-independent protein translocase protein TatA